MALEKYRAKRNFGITPEPRGGHVSKAAGRSLSFVVQKHAASHLHYDFRLEHDGVLLSWAIPKGPSFNPSDKRLAMHVEDHPLEYGGFEGIIPAKQYGGGTVMLWDRGTWVPKVDPKAGLAKGSLKFELHGQKLRGNWALVRTHSSKYGGKDGNQAWLLVKEKDAFAQANGGPSIVDAAPNSVTSGRSLDQIARAKERVWQSNRSVQENVKAGAVTVDRPAKAKTSKGRGDAAPAPGAKIGPMPAMIAPVLCTLVDEPPAGDDWLHEIKYDGYRMVCRIERGKAHLFSRNGKDWTHAFPAIAGEFGQLPVKTAWLDGEVCAMDAAGKPSFQALQNALSTPDAPLTMFVFDLIYLDGYDLRGVVLTERKRLLRGVIGDGIGSLRVGPEVVGNGEQFFAQSCKLGLEGAVAKRADSLYRDGNRSRDWVKVKCLQRQEMVIGGYTEPQGARSGFGALLLGVHENGKLRYAGKVGTGFNDKALADIHALLKKREQPEPPFVDPPRGYEAKGAHWVKPDLVAEIAFTEWSNDGALRHPSFQGLRADKKAIDVVREKPVHEREIGARRTGKPPRATALPTKSTVIDASSATKIAGVPISNPDKLLFPESGLAKRDIAEYYEAIAPWILPHVARRPLSLVRCPDGWAKQCFYQKHADKSVNEAVARINVPEGDGTATYMGAGSAKALVALVQWGVLELHPWGSKEPRLDRPDRLIFDLDPDEGHGWEHLVTAVTLLKTLLEELGLRGFLKTTGGKGLHVVVPIRPTLSWEQAKGFTRAVADFLVRTFPDRFTATVSKARRKGKIFIDYLRNGEGATAIAPYAVRARNNAPVATPIHWEELAEDVRFDHFNVRNVRERLAGPAADPWADFATTRQAITKTAAQRIGYDLGGAGR